MIKWLVNTIITIILHIILKLDTSELKKVPQQGPVLAVLNHVNFLDAPVIITHLQPKRTTGLVKKETWDKPLMAFLFNVWEGIPIDRETADFAALNAAKNALKAEKILAIAPEGTRTEDGRLIRGKPGVAILAVQCDAPIVPIAYYGHELIKKNLKRLKRTPMKIKVGSAFKVDLKDTPKDKAVMQAVTDSIMLEIAALLPEKYQGFYRNHSFERGKFIKYLN